MRPSITSRCCAGEHEVIAESAAHHQAARSDPNATPAGAYGRPRGGLQPSPAMGQPQSSRSAHEDEEEVSDKRQAGPFEAFGLAQTSTSPNGDEVEALGTNAEALQGERQPLEALGLAQPSPRDEAEEDLDTSAEELQGDARPFVAHGLSQSSPNEEELDTIAEEPVAESRASQDQGSQPQPASASEGPLERSQQQPAVKEEHELDASDMHDQKGSQVQSRRDVSQPTGGAGDSRGAGDGSQAKGAEGGGPRDAGEEASKRMDPEGRGYSHSHSHEPSEQPRHGPPGTVFPLHLPLTLHACQSLAGQCVHT